jgi:hypothetical protein
LQLLFSSACPKNSAKERIICLKRKTFLSVFFHFLQNF